MNRRTFTKSLALAVARPIEGTATVTGGLTAIPGIDVGHYRHTFS
jgi:hypothetical protein